MVTPAFESGIVFSTPSARSQTVSSEPFCHPALQHFPSAEKTGTERVIVALVAALVVIVPAVLRTRNYFVSGERELELVFAGIYSAVALAALLYLGTSIFSRCIEDLKARRFSGDVFAALAVSFLTLGIFIGWGIEREGLRIQSLAEALILLVSVFTLERSVSSGLYRRIFSALGFDLFKSVPRVRVIESMTVVPPETSAGFKLGSISAGLEEGWIALKDLKPGQLLRLREGELIPADGLVQDGVAKILERRVGGIGRMKLKARGDELFAGSAVLKGELTLKVTAAAEDSMITNFTSALAHSLLPEAAELNRFARLSKWVAGLICTAAVAAFVLHVFSGTGVSTALGIGAAIFAASAALRAVVCHALIEPLMVTGLFFRGVIVKSRRAFERLLSIRSLVLDSPVPGERFEYGDFQLLDDRLERNGVLSVLLALISRAEDEEYAALSDALIRKEKDLVPLEVQEARVYPGMGVCGTVNKVEFSAGSEEFLIRRGVQLQTSEIERENAGRDMVYLAMDDAVIARVPFSRQALGSGYSMVGFLRKRGISAWLCSARGTPLGGQEAASLGLEASNLCSELPAAAYLEKLQSLKPAGFLASSTSSRELIAASEVSFALFDTFAWKLDRTDFTLFTRNMQIVAELYSAARQLRRVSRLVLGLGLGLTVLLAALAWFSVIGAGTCAALSALGHLGLLSFALRSWASQGYRAA